MASRLPHSSRPNRTTGSSRQITARAEAHVIRLALLYALADGQRQIRAPHLTAALALQDYAARSAAWALTGATGDPLAEQIHATLRAHPGGLTRSQISQTLNHNQPAGQIDHALHALHAAGRVTATQIPTGGRPAQLWTATSRDHCQPRAARHEPARDPLPLRASGSHRSPDHARATDTSRAPQPSIVASDQSGSEAVSTRDAPRALPDPAPPSLQPLAVRSAHPPGVTSSFVPHPSMPPHSGTTMPKINGAQHSASAGASSHDANPLSNARNAMPCWAACCLAHSFPLR